MTDTLHWGVLGTGRIAATFARQLAQSRTGRLVAVASRSVNKARNFIAEHKLSDSVTSHGSYEELLADGNVQAVYIALPNHLHAPWSIQCAAAGKHVLCEKPMAVNWAQAMAMIEAARHHDVFFMEAFMYRCHPQTRKLVELIRDGAIGQVRHIESSFAFQMGPGTQDVRLDSTMAGGGIMDMGTYPMSLCRLVAGAALGRDFAEPLEIKGVGHIDPRHRVDLWASAALRFENDILATITGGIGLNKFGPALITGESGMIEVPSAYFCSGKDGKGQIILRRFGKDKEPQDISVEAYAGLYAIEADTVAEHLERRQATSPAMSWADSLGQAKAIETWRKSFGLIFDCEKREAQTLPASGKPVRKRPDAPMTYGRIDGLDKDIARLVLGSMQLPYSDMAFSSVMMDHYFELGGNCIDTAVVYGEAELSVGSWIAKRGVREQMVVLGKGAHTPYCNPRDLTRELLRTLERLQVDCLDLYMMHRDNLDIPVGEFVDVLNEHHRAGRIKAFGGSNWTIERVEAFNADARRRGLRPMTVMSNNLALARWNQPMWAGCISVSDAPSRAWHQKTRMPNFAWSSQASGFLADVFKPEDAANPKLAEVVRVWFNEENFRRLARARELAGKLGVHPLSVAVAWVLNQPFPTFALFGSANVDEMNTSMQALAIKLTSKQMAWLNLEADAPQ